MQASFSASSESTAKLTRPDLLHLTQRQWLVLAYVAAFIPALLMVVTQPVWSREDEAQHTDFIIQLSHGTYPQADRTLIDPETLRLTESTGVYRFEGPGTYPTPDISDVGPPPPGMSPRANAVWMSRHLWQLSYESAQTPAYYVLMVPVWSLSDAIGGTLGAVYVMRVINALIVALLAPMAVMVAWRVAPGRGVVAALAALFASFLPGLDLNVTRVGNDALGAAVGGLVIVLAVTWTGSTWTLRRALVLGLLFGAAVLVKLTLLGLAPAVAVAILWPSQPASLPRRFAWLMLTGAVTAACLCVWFVINLHVYGVPVPSARTNRLSVVPPQAWDIRFVIFELAFFVITYWSGEPLGTLPLAEGFVALGTVIALIAAVGLTRLRASGGMVLVGLAAIAGMAAVSLVLPATAGFQFAGPGRYEYPALPAIAALTALGIAAAITRDFAWRALAIMYGVGAATLLVGGAATLGRDTPASGSGAPPLSLSVVAAGSAGKLEGMQITVDGLALDRTNHVTWLRVTATNSGSDEIEWTPTPTVFVGDAMSTAVYERSTHFPGDLDPGQTLSGWLYLPMETQAGQSLHVVFPGVAVAQYSTVANISIDLTI